MSRLSCNAVKTPSGQHVMGTVLPAETPLQRPQLTPFSSLLFSARTSGGGKSRRLSCGSPQRRERAEQVWPSTSRRISRSPSPMGWASAWARPMTCRNLPSPCLPRSRPCRPIPSPNPPSYPSPPCHSIHSPWLSSAGLGCQQSPTKSPPSRKERGGTPKSSAFGIQT